VSSLRARLLAWLLAGVVLVGAAGGWVVYRNALAEADEFFDYHLRETALILRDEPVEYLLAPRLPPTDASYDFVVQVWSLDGVRVYLSHPHAVLPQITTLGFSTVPSSEGPWRVYGVQAATRVIQVGQLLRVRRQRAAGLAVQTLRPFLLLLPVLALLIWFAVGLALEPLQRLTGQVKARRVDALDALPAERLPDEVQPLVLALNDLLGRLRSALERERAFMADAAHELRTPLTALYLQLGMLARASGEAERESAMSTLSAGVQRAIHLVEQMLALARQEPRAGSPRVPMRLDELAREIVAELVPLADAGHIRRAAGDDRRRPGGTAHAAAQSRRQRGALHPGGRTCRCDGRQHRGRSAPHGERRWSGHSARGAPARLRSLLPPRGNGAVRKRPRPCDR